MEICYLGHSSFKIKGKEVTLVTDPYDSTGAPYLGFRFPKVEADVVTISHSHEDHNAAGLVSGNPFVISSPGEYEIKGVSVFGFSSYHDEKLGKEYGANTIYLIEMDGMRLCHLGDLGERLNDEKLEEIDGVDILMVPVGGFYTIGPKVAVELITKVEPKVVIPMHFKTEFSGSELDKLVSVAEFLKELGVEQVAPLPKFLISKDKLPQAERQIVILERKAS
jgi:L-ascorbate metabolism protein UlaG (beta-lactamase superfamily)